LRTIKKLIVLIIILNILSVPLYGIYTEKFTSPKIEGVNLAEKYLIHPSDIAGTDLYAESINAFVAGNKSLIKQSLFTNDTSILPHFDTRDPAFYKCNVLFSASNGITPEIFPRIFNEDSYSKQYGMTFNRFSGFLYYDEEMNVDDVQLRSVRALEIIKRKFDLDLIMINESNPYFFPFVGYYPNWELFFYETTNNLPMDGYWKALDIERLISKDYIENQHLSSTFLLVNSLDLLELDITESIDQVNFNLDSLDLEFLENFEVDNIFEQFSNIPSLFGDISNFTDSNQTTQADFEEFGEVFNTLKLSNESHYVSLTMQYEGLSSGIKKIGEDEYTFNLWNAMGYQGDSLQPSEKIFIALTGALMSEIDINIFCTDIVDVTPQYFTLYEFLLEQISLLLFYAGVDFDIQTLKEYSFELFWVDENGFKRSYIKPVNLNEPTDFINFLHPLGFQGLPGIPTGIFNPIEDFEITYKVSNSEPNLLIVKDLIGNNASHGVYNDFSFNITAKNVGNETAWGVPTPIPIELDDVFTLIIGPIGVLLGLDENLKDAIWEVVRIEYFGQYTSLEDFFNYDENPRIFYFDTSGTGLVDSYYPNLNNITNLLPYNENMNNVIDIISGPNGNPQLISALNSIGLPSNSLKDMFTNKNSVWNDDNWKLEPQEIISYTLDNFSVEEFDTFSSFYKYNFSIKESFPSLPSILSGVSIADTTPQMALNADNESWIVESEEKFINQHEIEIQFLFQNGTEIDLVNNSLDRVSILANFSDPNNVLSFEVFNYTTEEFQSISQYLTSSVNNTSIFTFVKNEGTFNWLFDPSARYNQTILLKIKGTNGSLFNISINDLDIELYYRDINEYTVLGSRVIFTSSSGIVEYVSESNTISLSTYKMSSLIAYAYLDSYSSYVGNINNYTLIYRNIGSNFVKNIDISIPIPGIIFNPINFSIEDNYLKYTISELAPGAQEKVVFSFYVPNSAILSNTIISYNNSEHIQNLNSTSLETFPNEVRFTAPVDYLSRFPYIKTVEIYYYASNLAPAIGEELNLSIYIRNKSPEGMSIQNLSISMNDQYGDLARIDNETLILADMDYNESRSVNFTLKKRDWKGYYYPSVNYFENSDNLLIQIALSNPIILGIVNFSIIKSVDKNQIEIGDVINVSITVRNIGNIFAKNITINDASSFTNINFELVSGSLINTISELLPGEQITFSYKIQAITKAIVKLKPASIERYYLIKSIDMSNWVEIKVIIPENIQMYFVLGPSIVAVIILIAFVWENRRYNVKKHELQRNELMLFEISHSDAILKIENTLRDRFNLMSLTKEDVTIEEENGGEVDS
jgi:uncharacterized repeat protein (TIGR01451 family)